MPGGNPAIYLMHSCTNAFSCVSGADANGDTSEVLSYMNTSTSTETLYLAVDTVDTLAPYFLTIDIY
jgi:hypothetical protein